MKEVIGRDVERSRGITRLSTRVLTNHQFTLHQMSHKGGITMKALRVVLTSALIGILFGAISVVAQPAMINYQGKLAHDTGWPVTDNVSIVFSIYDQVTGGVPVWTETHSSVGIQSGIYNVLLGSMNPIPDDVFDGGDRWLGIRINDDSEMTPRQRIASVGYAINSDMVDGQHAMELLSAAEAAATAGDYGRSGVAASLYEGTSTLSDRYVNEGQANSITSNMIVNGTILAADLSFGLPDGHSLDAADGNPTDAVYVDASGNVTLKKSITLEHGNVKLNNGNVYSETGSDPTVYNVAVWGKHSASGNFGYIGNKDYGGRFEHGDGNYCYIGSSDYALLASNPHPSAETGAYLASNTGVGVYGKGAPAGLFKGQLYVDGYMQTTGVVIAGAGIKFPDQSLLTSAFSAPNECHGQFKVTNNSATEVPWAFGGNYALIVSNEETDDTGEDGIAIQLGTDKDGGNYGTGNEFISFFDLEADEVGRIEGFRTTQWAEDHACFSWNPLDPCSFDECDLVEIGFDPASAAAYGAQLVCNDKGVAYCSHNGDYSEWLPKIDPDEEIAPGDIVGLHGGFISKNTEGAKKIMVISSGPVVLGNMPKEEEEYRFEPVAFLGQVLVKVVGPVSIGDYILPSGLDDGTGVAVSPEDMTAEDYTMVVGRAWSQSDYPGLKPVLCAVGLASNDWVGLVEKQQVLLDQQERRIEEQQCLIDELLIRLDTLEERVNEISGFSGEKMSAVIHQGHETNQDTESR